MSIEELNAALEPEAVRRGYPDGRTMYAMSTAISLKRIADALEGKVDKAYLAGIDAGMVLAEKPRTDWRQHVEAMIDAVDEHAWDVARAAAARALIEAQHG